jgi:hypothetical protein
MNLPRIGIPERRVERRDPHSGDWIIFKFRLPFIGTVAAATYLTINQSLRLFYWIGNARGSFLLMDQRDAKRGLARW